MQDLDVRRDGHVATLTLRRPPDNYIDVDLASALADSVLALEADPDCRAIVIASEGKHFCAGARLDPTSAAIPPDSGNPLYDEVVRLFTGSIPIVAAVQGAAIGAGLGLALAADLRVACPEARFGATFARLGFHHGFGITVTLPRVVGEPHALDMLYTGRRVGGDEARAIGLCDRLVDRDLVVDAAVELAGEIAQSGPLAVRAIRRTMRGGLVEEVRAATDVEHAAQQVLRRTDDFREGVRATAERRTPSFEGR